MHIIRLTLAAHDLYAANDFYAAKLGLPLLEIDAESITFQVGTTELTFHTSDHAAQHHIAFNIPENQIEDGFTWINQFAPTMTTDTGDDIAHFAAWNAHSVYCFDPLGNILELIARHDLQNPSHAPFSAESLLSISEVAIPVDDVVTAADDVVHTTGDPFYLGEYSDTFTAVGDEEGLLIVVKHGREFYPLTGVLAHDVPLSLCVRGANGHVIDLLG